MPYIPSPDRKAIDAALEALFPTLKASGQYNYAICKLILDFIQKSKGGLCYENLNSAIGILECAKQEIYARVARKYEDRKASENGDVF